ncbi:MAG: TetR/AcrR family transcriptional regulator [Thermoanaerobaculales bacterium]
MSRPRDPEARSRLREAAIDYVLENGLAGSSLRPMAGAMGTSARMLVYHFGSREGLMREVLAGLRQREDARIAAWWEKRPALRTLPEFMRWLWKRLGEHEAMPALRLIFELYALALRHPEQYPGVLEDPVAYWQQLTRRAGMRTDAATATLLLAVTRGLALDLAATGQRARVGKALALMCTMLEDRRDGGKT